MTVTTPTAPGPAVTPPAAGPPPRPRPLRTFLTQWGPAIPFLVTAGGLLVAAAIWLIRSSFAGPDGGWTLQAWQDIFTQRITRDAMVRSLGLSAIVATFCLVVGSVLAYLISGLARRGRAGAQALLNVAANFGGASLAIAMVSTLGAVGFVRLLLENWFGYHLGLDLYSVWGLVVTYIYFILPLYVLLVLPAMSVLRPEWWEAVQTAGGTRWQYWRRVGLPVLFPFLLSGWVLTFAWSLGQFSVPYALLGDTTTTSLITTRLGNFLFSATGGTNRFERAAALAVLLMVISALALVAYRRIAARMLARLEGLR
ncbi:ABC transporter permease subunit [Mycolicibacterium austroafricanum]|uniref:ABC transporter permease subunit n=1 Tax=Mycolicibacterium austroafricanum TaxID=39687 RepID=UPI00056D9301|nr:ABC transporter permease subunit [Mycolicibacterium austroafricanum]QZY45981.1 ABC transporter permease subunit [Mycolicibacterium austroafricanum]